MNTESNESADPTETHVEEVSEEALGSQSSTNKNSPIKIAVYLGLGVVAIYLATWLGPVAFHLNFQGKMLAAREEVPGLVVWTRPEEVPAVNAEGWNVRKEGDFLIPVPPGTPEFTRENETVVATFEEGVITYRRFPAGFVGNLIQKEAETVGAKIDATKSDISSLRDLLEETCENYEFGWSGSRRSLYAARILSKMLLWEEKALQKFQFASRSGALSVLTEYENGAAAIIVAEDDGVLVVRIPEESPASWKTSAADWLPEAK